MTETNLIEDLRLLSPPSYGWVLALFLAAMAMGGLLMLRKLLSARQKPGVAAEVGPALWDTALSELERLTHLLAPEHSREYAICATSILRRYIEARYSLQAPTLATEEFLELARFSPGIPSAHRQSLGTFLELCDLLKFARFVGTAEELGKLHTAAVEFVLASRSEPVAPASAGGGAC